MRPRERRDSGQSDLFKARLDQIVDLDDPLPTRLMAGLAILNHMHDLSDDALRERWIENPYCQMTARHRTYQTRAAQPLRGLTYYRPQPKPSIGSAAMQPALA